MKTMKSTMARLFALCLTVAMVLSMATMGAFAGTTPITKETQTGTINIRGTDRDVNTKVKLYQIITVNLDENTFQPKDPVYQWVDEVAALLKESEYAKYVDTKNHNAVTEAFSLKTSEEDEVGSTAAELSAFYDALATVIEHKALVLDEPREAVVNGTSATSVGPMPLGQYLIIADDTGSYEHKPATATLYPQWGDHDGKPETNETWYVEDANVVLKGDKGTIDKEVDNPTVSVGDEVTYTVKASVPVYPEDATATAFNVGDKMSHGLTWDKAVTVYWSEDGIMNTVEKGEGDNVTVVPDPEYRVDASNYTLATPETDEDLEEDITFEVQFNYDKLTTDYRTAKYVHVEYTATINEHAFEEDALGNDAYLGVNTNPYDGGSYETTPTEEDVYTYGINVTKVDANDLVALLGAEFKLYSDKECTKEIKFVDSDGYYTRAKDQESAGVTLKTNGLGQVILGGLDTGTYYLKEVKAPDGYQLPKNVDAITEITITDTTGGDNGADGILDSGSAEGSMVVKDSSATEGKVISFKLGNNKPGFELPTTGGMGTVLFTAGGLVIMACGAALVLVTLKKKKAED